MHHLYDIAHSTAVCRGQLMPRTHAASGGVPGVWHSPHAVLWCVVEPSQSSVDINFVLKAAVQALKKHATWCTGGSMLHFPPSWKDCQHHCRQPGFTLPGTMVEAAAAAAT